MPERGYTELVAAIRTLRASSCDWAQNSEIYRSVWRHVVYITSGPVEPLFFGYSRGG